MTTPKTNTSGLMGDKHTTGRLITPSYRKKLLDIARELGITMLSYEVEEPVKSKIIHLLGFISALE